MFLISFHIFELASRIFRKQFYLKTKYRRPMQDNNTANDISQAVCSTCDLQEQEVQNEYLIYLQQCENLDGLSRQYQKILNIYLSSLVGKTGCTQEKSQLNVTCFEKFIPNFDELVITNYKLEDKIMIFLDEVVKRLKYCNYTTLLLPLETKEINSNISNNNHNIFTVSDTEHSASRVQNVIKKNKKDMKKLKRIMQRRLLKKKCKAIDVISSQHRTSIKKTESRTSQDSTAYVKKIVESRFCPWTNEEYIENIAHPLSIDDVTKEFSVILYIKYQNSMACSTNELNFIETVKRDLAVHLLESAFPEQTEVEYVRVKSITEYLQNLQAVSSVFSHQRLTDETYDAILLVSQAVASLLRHPYLSLYESLAQILQTAPSNIITLKNV